MIRPFALIPLEQWLDLPPAVIVLNWLVSMDGDPGIDDASFGEAKQALMSSWSAAKEQARARS